MIRQVLILSVIVGSTNSVLADSPAESYFDHRSWEVGSVPRGMTLHHVVTLTNLTAKPVRIASIRVSCGCVAASALKKELAPGEQTSLLVQLESRQFTGPIQKTVFVLFDQPTVEEVRFLVGANVLTDLSVTPAGLVFSNVERGKSPQQSVVVTLPDGYARLDKASSESSYIQVRLEPIQSAGPRTYRVTATLRPDLPEGYWQSTVWLAGDNPSQPPINIPMIVRVTAPRPAAANKR
jgi:hypothetical protein